MVFCCIDMLGLMYCCINIAIHIVAEGQVRVRNV